MGLHRFLALSGWLSFRNFGIPGTLGWATLRRSKHSNLLQLDRPSLTLKGSALPSPTYLRPPKRGLRVGGSGFAQAGPKFSKRTILAGLVLFLPGFRFFHSFSQSRVVKWRAAEPVWLPSITEEAQQKEGNSIDDFFQ